ncbi:phosphotransferase family protein [Yinghuangia seranimata]|uniref:phosphotransferase family protein n=1 Tax=Yinghuangia seranimata TaxID=408067 RepID=UPI00248B54A3|nr:phosphotransferase family protein [Yinghuangia seranimata]MDI2131461.1 phosphotransferase family protein [Yinghuangia seranimata]
MSPLVDEAALAAWLDERGLAPGAPLAVEPLSGGKSNAMFTVRRGGQAWVLRRPAGVAIDRAEDGLRREFRILDALNATDVPHPRAVALCDERTVLGSVFYLMERVDGAAPLPNALPEPLADEAGRRAIGLAMVDALADLHAVDPYAVGLGDLGRPEGFHERQVGRWLKQLHGYPDPHALTGIERVAEWLATRLPPDFTPVLMHGDYHFGNVLVAPDEPARVTAIVDWETATLGDPLLDLAGFLRIWFETGPHEGTSWDEMAERYARRSGRDLPDLTYYVTLSRFRLAVLLEGIHQRSLSDPNREPQRELGDYARRLVADAVTALDDGSAG